MRPAAGLALAATLVLTAAGCSSDGPEQVAAGHTHVGGAMVSMAVGEGTTSSEVGYSLDGLQVREQPDGIGEVRFRIDDHEGEPVTDYVEELTKELHLARDEGGNGDHVVLGRQLALPPGDPGDTVAGDDVVSVTVSRAPTTGPHGVLHLVVRDAAGGPVNLGTYLGTYGHVTGFNTETDAMVHLRPLAAPEITEDGSELTFHSDIEEAGDYRLFAQVRVDGFLHTVPVELNVRRGA